MKAFWVPQKPEDKGVEISFHLSAPFMAFRPFRIRMIYIKEVFPDDQSVAIKVDGMLDVASISVLDSLCQCNLQEGKMVSLHLKGLLHISREGMHFLQQMQKKVRIVDSPPFVKLKNLDLPNEKMKG